MDKLISRAERWSGRRLGPDQVGFGGRPGRGGGGGRRKGGGEGVEGEQRGGVW